MSLKRSTRNPIITRNDIPHISPHLVDVSSVFNPGAVKYKDQYLLILRVQNRGRETFLLKAVSDNGIDFTIDDNIINLVGIEDIKWKIYHNYDPRITRIADRYYIVFAIDTDNGCRLGIAETEDFEDYKFIGIIAEDDTRNGVLFPDKIDDKFLMLERPNNVNLTNTLRSGDTIFLSESKDIKKWLRTTPVMSGRWHYWDEIIGAGPPPVKTREGWLLIYHGVATHLSSAHIYQAGCALLDLSNPAKVIARSRYNILEPREKYEMTGQVPNVVFPSGMIVEDFDNEGYAMPESEVKIYYGAADTCIGLAITTIKDLIEACLAGSKS